jgi:hypothetical protein
MIYLIDPQNTLRQSVTGDCRLKCSTYCGIKPLYGIDPVEI